MIAGSKMYWIHCLSPVHIGTGQGVGAIDMPMMRERITEWPYIPGSSIKGVQRESLAAELEKREGNAASVPLKKEEWLNAAFGKADQRDSGGKGIEGNAGALVFSDSRLFAFPVASFYGTFAYVTCPLAVRRLARDLAAAGMVACPDIGELEQELTDSRAWITTGSALTNSASGDGKAPSVHSAADWKDENTLPLFLDEFECRALKSDKLDLLATWAGERIFADDVSRRMFKERLVLVSDESFQYFVTMCCEVTPRIRISPDTKTVQNGMLWSEEYLPTESILYGIVWCDRLYTRIEGLTEQSLLSRLSGTKMLQIGGNLTVGKGRVQCRFSGGERA
ncbi:MAG: type III-B CRISPR module RAMP protein Cmr4 [Paenibacillus macerans]|uniref:RAMP superfamily protein n=1 Tax=Paenibacillus macerans TaxID=44252 RepID=A0A090Z9G1_PAEMA|nr:type III-B CRISPR module RAMP protein Cmr4 [Paenibacillus macerans]KFN07013.1 RAMP superfamily protein [Paenibacillus macerans]MBS5910521.1 type III-B CRISPR module RAMP protein Cmr4 [Paenibacillus macerans]MCY7561994.1 type III-B CRISPR module RAMP protein Cmr4 [Paenibacillus macerans]MDU7475374.1 type III-B CRISPR module RAMP protein Cmr4 [Paenibacillus macerans]MEC0151101.1 type III-B CRISPR module RAMP protein Cmr4 [Paenibacillus macerans]